MNATKSPRAESSERNRPADTLSDRELSIVAGGFSFVKRCDKSSPILR
jgi:type VI protein secretion system component Hcp